MKTLVLSFTVLALVLGDDEYRRIFDAADLNKDGFVVQAEYDSVYAVFDPNNSGSVSVEAFLAIYPKATGRSETEALFRFFLIDANGDLKISLAEYDDSFAPQDANNDGKLSFDEYKAGSSQVKSLLHEALKEEHWLREKFRQADKNNNGTLDPTELLSYLMEADRNGDGGVSVAEFVEFWNAGFPETFSDGVKRFAAFLFQFLDEDDDGLFGVDPTEKRLAFSEFDYNGSGDIDVQEYLNTLLFFYTRLLRAPTTNPVD